MVNVDRDGVISIGVRELGNQIDSDFFPESGGYSQGLRDCPWVALEFLSCTGFTSFDIFFYKGT